MLSCCRRPVITCEDMTDLTIAQAAESLGVHPVSIRRYISQGRLRAYRVGPRNIRVHADDIERIKTPIGGSV
jgi:excisionase family DNA binding protein